MGDSSLDFSTNGAQSLHLQNYLRSRKTNLNLYEVVPDEAISLIHRPSDINFACGQCDRLFSAYGDLKAHRNEHEKSISKTKDGIGCHNHKEHLVKPFLQTSLIDSGSVGVINDLEDFSTIEPTVNTNPTPHRLPSGGLSCQICDFKAKSKGGLKRHKKVHSGRVGLLADVFATVGDQTSASSQLTQLLQRKRDEFFQQNPNDNRWPCAFCGQLCKTLAGCKGHITRSHPNVSRGIIANDIDLEAAANTANVPTPHMQNEFSIIIRRLTDLLATNKTNHDELDAILSDYVVALKKCEKILTGPEHPSRKFYRLRKSNAFQRTDRTYSESSNPQRASQRDRDKRRAKFDREKTQWLYFNQRKKAVHSIIKDKNDKGCTIELADIHREFSSRWETPNDKTRPPLNPVTPDEQLLLDNDFNINVTVEEAAAHITKLDSQSAAGPDGIIPRWVKATKENSAQIISKVMTYMLMFDHVPNSFHEARTVLFYKDKGDRNDPKNYRPITICSVIRRVIEKILDKKIRYYVPFSNFQRGFTNINGTLVNTSILNACLKKAKEEKLNFSTVLLDVTQAFDKIGHKHCEIRIKARRAPSCLKSLSINLMKGNFTQINTIKGKTEKIFFKCGVIQGGPHSPWIYNNSVDDEIDEFNESSVKSTFGFQLHHNSENEILQNFADDSNLFANSRNSASTLTQTFIGVYDELGLEVNPDKSVCISIVEGKLYTEDLTINSTTKISCIGPTDVIKYLGTNFNDEIIVNEAIMLQQLRRQVERLVSTPLLNPDQKFNIINDFIWPTIIFPFQHAPLSKLPTTFLADIDKILKSAIKEILQIPNATPDAMIYSSKNVKGLGLIKATWEAFIQSYNASDYLQHCGIEVLSEIRDFKSEKLYCLNKLPLSEETKAMISSEQQNVLPPINIRGKGKCKFLRSELQKLQFEAWCALPTKGRGVCQFADYPTANKWLSTKFGLSTSEWTNAIKMTGNVLPVKTNPGYGQGNGRCRHCDEFETLGHILGNCRRGELLRNNRHHSIRSLLATKLKDRPWIVEEEISCIDINGVSRRVDIFAFNRTSNKGFIIDPTIRMESEYDQYETVNTEKKAIYDPCIPYFQSKYNITNIEVIGLYIGARGTITKHFVQFLKDFKIPLVVIETIVTIVLKAGSLICNQHLYS